MRTLEGIMNLKNDYSEENIIVREELIQDLKDGICKVTFTKKDGTERLMKCTLASKFMPITESTKTTEDKEPNLDIIKCWDLEKEAWRSFRLDSVKIAYLEQYADKV